MPVTSQDAGSATIATRIAGVLAAEIGQAAEREEFGLLVQDVHPINLGALAETLAQPKFPKKGCLRIVLVDEESAVSAAIARHPVLNDLLAYKKQPLLGAISTSGPSPSLPIVRSLRRPLCASSARSASVTLFAASAASKAERRQ
jgi:hypothetical protein